MKSTRSNALRFAGFTALTILLLAAGLFIRSWLNSPYSPQPGVAPSEPGAPTATAEADEAPGPTALVPPLAIDPSLCAGPSISPSMPGDDIAFDGGRVVTEDNITFEFWLTCTNTTENYAAGTQPIVRLGLHALWIYPIKNKENHIRVK